MGSFQLFRLNSKTPMHHHQVHYRALKLLSYLFLLGLLVTGCTSSTPLYLQNHFPAELKTAETLQSSWSQTYSERIPLGLAIVLRSGTDDDPVAVDKSWMQFAASVKNNVEKAAPVLMKEVIIVKDLGSEENLSRIQQFGKELETDAILIVVPSENEVVGPAQFDLLPEVSLLQGNQIDHYASIELGLVDSNSGKLFVQVQGQSYATLEKLDIPIKSNRYPRIKGSAMTSYIYPEDERAMETLRAVALNEALEQATLRLKERYFLKT